MPDETPIAESASARPRSFGSPSTTSSGRSASRDPEEHSSEDGEDGQTDEHDRQREALLPIAKEHGTKRLNLLRHLLTNLDQLIYTQIVYMYYLECVSCILPLF